MVVERRYNDGETCPWPKSLCGAVENVGVSIAVAEVGRGGRGQLS